MGSAERIYADPSALRRIYVHDGASRAFCTWRGRVRGSLPLTLFGRAELVNSIALAVFRGDIGKDVGVGALVDLDNDLTAGRFHLADLLWRRALERTTDLSREHTPKLGTRTLDVLHVGSALVLGCKSFVTYDHRQAALARVAGLRLISP